MELYFKDLISKESSLEKLAEDLALLSQGADHFTHAVGAAMPDESRREIFDRLERLKESCRRARDQAIASAQATDRFLRRHPYASLGTVFALGLLLGARFLRRK